MDNQRNNGNSKKMFGLSLAGGGLKSFSQLAVLYDLEERQIAIDAVAGTSMGAVIAALVACGLTATEIEETLLDEEREFADRGVFSRPAYLLFQHVREHNNGFVELQSLQQMACQLFEKIGCRMLSDCRLPIAITTVDIHTSELIVFTNRPEFFTSPTGDWIIYPRDIELGIAIAASCAFPMIFSTASLDGRQLVDGGVMMNLPIPLFDRSLFSVLMSVSMIYDAVDRQLESPFNVAIQSLDILIRQMDRQLTKQADIQVNFPIEPHLVFKVGAGREVIAMAKEMLQNNPIDYSMLETHQHRG
ncbi:MAG: patatin-like phospholipase family protein [Trichococcus sp.]